MVGDQGSGVGKDQWSGVGSQESGERTGVKSQRAGIGSQRG